MEETPAEALQPAGKHTFNAAEPHNTASTIYVYIYYYSIYHMDIITVTATSMKQTSQIDLIHLQAAAGKAGGLLKALANPDRLLLLCQMTQGEFAVGALEELTGIRQPTLSQQLTVLREEKLVHARREGKQVFYSVASKEALAVLQVLYALYCPKDEEA